MAILEYTLPEIKSSPRKIDLPKREVAGEATIFRCELLVLGSVVEVVLVFHHE